MATVNGTTGNDLVHVFDDMRFVPPGYTEIDTATDGADAIGSGNGGDDRIYAGGGDDTIAFAGDLTAADRIFGEAGNDTLVINDQTTVTFSAASLFGIEKILLPFVDVPMGFLGSHHFVFDDANVAAGADLLIDGSDLGPGFFLEVNFAAETDAHAITVRGGAGNDAITGRANGILDVIDLTAGGNDSAAGAGEIRFGDTLTANDRVEGFGTATVYVLGDYATGLTLTGAMLSNIAVFDIASSNLIGGSGSSYTFVADDTLLAAGRHLSVEAGGGRQGRSILFDGSAETDGSFSMYGSRANDTFYGGGQDDSFNIAVLVPSGVDADVVFGHGGDDTVNGGRAVTADDILDGGDGDDTLILDGNYSGGLVFGGAAIAHFETFILRASSLYSYVLTATDGAVAAGGLVTVDGSAIRAGDTLLFDGSAELDGAFAVTGGAGADTIVTGAGNDTLAGGLGADALTGGTGDDIYVNPAGDSVTEIAGAANGAHDLILSGASFNLAATPNVEDIALTGAANVNAIGGTGNNRLTGNAGNNILNGGGANDFLIGLGGADTLNGGSGNDVYVNPDSADVIGETAGAAGGTHDRIQTLYGFNLSAAANVEDLTLVGGNAVNAIGNNAANILIGNTGNNIINGGGGADTITGGAGNDTINGGAGADLFKFAVAGTGTDTINAFETSIDRFDLSGGLFSLRTEAGDNTTLTHAGGTILVTGVTGLNLAAWNALVVTGGRTGPADVHDNDDHFLAARFHSYTDYL